MSLKWQHGHKSGIKNGHPLNGSCMFGALWESRTAPAGSRVRLSGLNPPHSEWERQEELNFSQLLVWRWEPAAALSVSHKVFSQRSSTVWHIFLPLCTFSLGWKTFFSFFFFFFLFQRLQQKGLQLWQANPPFKCRSITLEMWGTVLLRRPVRTRVSVDESVSNTSLKPCELSLI